MVHQEDGSIWRLVLLITRTKIAPAPPPPASILSGRSISTSSTSRSSLMMSSLSLNDDQTLETKKRKTLHGYLDTISDDEKAKLEQVFGRAVPCNGLPFSLFEKPEWSNSLKHFVPALNFHQGTKIHNV
jgi:hypothetical protein